MLPRDDKPKRRMTYQQAMLLREYQNQDEFAQEKMLDDLMRARDLRG